MEISRYCCKTCQKNFIDLSYFYQHLKNQNHLKIFCPLAGCDKKYDNYKSLQFHISKHKRIPAVEDKFHIKCPIKSCKLDIDSRTVYLQHMPLHLKEGETFNCAYPNCDSFIGTLSSFRSHVSNFHSIKQSKILSEIDKVESSEESSHNLSFDGEPSKEVSCKPPLSEMEPSQECRIQSEPVLHHNHGSLNKNIKIQEPLPECEIKDHLAKFYLRLEAEYYLPTSTVQKIADEVTLITEFSHSHLKKSLKLQLETAGLEDGDVTEIIANTFRSDPVFNCHHKNEDAEQLGTDHLRRKFWSENYPWIDPIPISLGKDQNGKKQTAYYVPIRKSIESMLRDPVVKKKVLESFNQKKGPFNILSDITDGTAFQKHRAQHHNGKCLFINLFQDGCDNNAFGPTIGKYKPNNFYFSLGNLSAESRTKLSTIHLVYAVLEKHLKNSEGEELRDVSKLKIVLRPLIDEMKDLKQNGMEIDGERVPVCLLFGQGDNAGQHFLGGFVGSFSCEYCCRFCDITLTEFRKEPTLSKPLRTPESYDQYVQLAKADWLVLRNRSVKVAEERRERRLLNAIRAPGRRATTKRLLSKSALQKLKGIHHKGVKYRPSPLNSAELQFHVCSGPALPVCIVHDFWEGIAKNMLPKILSTFADKGWFDLDTLNRRIESFSYEGSDKKDAPTRLKCLTSLGGNASENWTLVRMLPLLIGDLIEDKQDEMWQLYLQFKVIAEYVFAPSITVHQVLYLKMLISEYLNEVKRLLPECLYPKHHLLNHYPELILAYGPLIRLFTLRFESFHVFFKNVAKACRNYINFTYTLARKYMCKFALDHSSGLISEEVQFDSCHLSSVFELNLSEEERNSIPEEVFSGSHVVLARVSVKGVEYSELSCMILGLKDVCDEDIKVGIIEKMFLNVHSRTVSFLLNIKSAENTHLGYYKVHMPANSYLFSSLDSLPDYYPLPCYNVFNTPCITLKHSNVKM